MSDKEKIAAITFEFRSIAIEDLTTMELKVREIVTGEKSTAEQKDQSELNTARL